MTPHILLVDDEPAALFGFSKFLNKAGYTVTEASCLSEAREALIGRRFDAVILDMFLPDGIGIDLVGEIRKSYPDVAIVVITGMGDIPLAVDAMRRGADNFLTKPVSLVDLDVFLRKSLELAALRRKNLTEERLSQKGLPYFGKSAAIKKIMDLALLAAENGSAVLLQGETGTGKGVLAKWIYEHAPQASGPFVEVNCSGLRGELLSSELFGHVKGAFTSAIQERQGLIEIADGGTLFLDEIADMDFAVQAQFLKVIEEKQYRRLGDVKVRKSDFRLICATNRELKEETRLGRFRSDLFFRINVFPIRLPSLRQRPEDFAGLVRHFLICFRAPHPEVSSEVMALLESYPWPGNVRELRNVLERALLIARGAPLKPDHFPGIEFSEAPSNGLGPRDDLAQLEMEHIRSIIENTKGDLKKAADAMGISRATLYRKMKKFRDTQ